MFPTAGIALDAGRFVIGTATWTVEEMYDAGRRQQIEATLFGRGADVALGSINNLLAQDPCFDSGPVRNRRISRESVGREVRSEAALRELWFTHYRNFLLGGPMATREVQSGDCDQPAAPAGSSATPSKWAGTWKDGPVQGEKRQCTWQGTWVDSTKDVSESGTADLEFGASSLTLSTLKTSVNVKPAPGWDWSRDPQWNPGSRGVYRFRRSH